jgi:putative transposase
MLINDVFRIIFMKTTRAWKFRLYPSKTQQRELTRYLYECKTLWNGLLEYTKKYYEETGKFPSRKQLYIQTKQTALFSQVAQNVADRLIKSLRGVAARKRAGLKAGFPRFKPIERMKSFTYPQFGFRLGERLELSALGDIPIKKHRQTQGKVKTLTIKKSPSGKWFVVFTTEVESAIHCRKAGPLAGMDLGVERFACLSDGETIENPRHLRQAEGRLKERQRQLSHKKKGSKNRQKAKYGVAVAYEKLANRRRDFLHKTSRELVAAYSFLALENLKPVWQEVSMQNPCWIAAGQSLSACFATKRKRLVARSCWWILPTPPKGAAAAVWYGRNRLQRGGTVVPVAHPCTGTSMRR